MGLFSKIFSVFSGKNREGKDIFSSNQSEEMLEANKKARETFPYFWREVFWEYRRIIPALQMSGVKVKFEEPRNNSEEKIVEYMWVSNIDFDGDVINGQLLNNPNEIKSIKQGENVSVRKEDIYDWIFAINGQTFGAFTVHVIRKEMSTKEMKNHDNAWGLDFGDSHNVLIAYDQENHPENLDDHPMSKNMAASLQDYIEKGANINELDENNQTMLHHNAIAGNLACVNKLLELGADKGIKSKTGKTAYDYAVEMNWPLCVEELKN